MGKLTDDQLRFIIDIEANGAQGQINTLNAEMLCMSFKKSKHIVLKQLLLTEGADIHNKDYSVVKTFRVGRVSPYFYIV